MLVPRHAAQPNPSVKALPPVAGTRRKQRAPYLKRSAAWLKDFERADIPWGSGS